MSTITDLNVADTGAASRTVINANFDNLNTDKAELASPTFTGTPSLPTGTTAVTQSANDNSTKVATTAYVYTAVSTGSTSGVSAGPSTSSTQTITHGLGRTPVIIRIYGVSSTNTTGPGCISTGTYNTTGNRCSYLPAGNSTRTGTTSTTFAVRLALNNAGSEGNVTTGVIQNIGSTSFDIVWTSAGTVVDSSFIWEAQ